MAVKNKERTTQSELNDKNLRECCEKRELDKNWILANGSSIDIFKASETLRCKAKSGGILFEGANGQFQFKPDKPWSDRQGKKAARYRTAAGDEWDAYLPCHPTDPNYWDDIEALKELCYKINDVPMLLITEGVFKAISSCSHGYPTIALLGVEMGLTSSKNDPQGKRFLVDTLEKYAKHGFGFIFAFDADIYTNKNVLKALVKLAEQLQKFDVPVYNLPKWDESEGKGIDDYIQKQGIEAFRKKLIAQATSYERWKSEYAEDIFDNKPPKPDMIAKELAEEYEEQWIYCDELKAWLVYESNLKGVWSIVSEKYIQVQINSILKARNIQGYGGVSYKKNILGHLEDELYQKEWNEKPSTEWLPFEDGVLELATMKLHQHSPDNRFTWQLPRSYFVKESNWLSIEKWLEEATGGNQRYKDLILCFAAAALRGMNDEQKFLHLIGTGGSGKSTLTTLLTALIGGENTVTPNLSDLEDKHEIARIFGKRLVVLADQDKASKTLSNFKRLTGQDRLSGRKLYQEGFEFIFGGLVMITSNFPIFHTSTGSWLTRRAITIPFNYKCPDSKKRNLNKEFEPELSAFTSYLLSIPIEKIKSTLKGRGQPKLSPTAWDTQIRSDSLSAWINDWVIRDDTHRVPIGSNKDEWSTREYNQSESSLYGSYALYCKRTNRTPKSPQNFSAELIDMGNNVLGWSLRKGRTSSMRYIEGIRLRSFTDTELTLEEILESNDKASDREYDKGGDNLKPLKNKGSDNYDKFFPKSSEKKEEKNNRVSDSIDRENNTGEEKINSSSSSPSPDSEKEAGFISYNKNNKIEDEVVTVVKSPKKQDFQPVTSPVNSSVTPPVIKESDWKTYPYNSKDVLTLKQRAERVKERIFKCKTKNDLDKLILCPEGKATQRELDWLMENYFTDSECSRVESISTCIQTNLFNQPEVESVPEKETTREIDFDDAIKEIDRLMEAVGMSEEEGKQWLMESYGKRSRSELTDLEFSYFYCYLESVEAGTLDRNWRPDKQ